MNKQKKRVEAVFDEVAKTISVQKKDIAGFKLVADQFDLDGKTILEAGCGIGDNLIYCMEKGAVYLEGFDISEESVNIAREKTIGQTRISFKKCSIEEYQPTRKFDVVFGWGVFEYFDDPFNALKKMVGMTNDNAIILLLISKPILLKRIAGFFRYILSLVPIRLSTSVAKILSVLLNKFTFLLNNILYMGESSTYSFEQTIMEGLMVDRYNVFGHEQFVNYLQDNGFTVKVVSSGSDSMLCISAER